MKNKLTYQPHDRLLRLRLFSVAIIVSFTIISLQTFADTIDVWTMKKNGAIIIRSNEMLIVHSNQPMQINLDSCLDNDTLQICLWTDSEMEIYKWYYIFKDTTNKILCTFTNSIDSTARCLPSPCKTFTDRKDYIPFGVKYLKKLMKDNNVNRLFVEFKWDNKKWGNSYFQKPVSIISID